MWRGPQVYPVNGHVTRAQVIVRAGRACGTVSWTSAAWMVEKRRVNAGENTESSSTKLLQGFSVAWIYQVYARRLDVVCSGYRSFAGTCLCHLLQMWKTQRKINPYSCILKKICVVNTCSDTPSLWLLRHDVGQLGRQQQRGSQKWLTKTTSSKISGDLSHHIWTVVAEKGYHLCSRFFNSLDWRLACVVPAVLHDLKWQRGNMNNKLCKSWFAESLWISE